MNSYVSNNCQFEVFYQPLVCLSTGKISGFEALLRWQHPTKGYISPDDFIPIAEDTGSIVPLGSWVLQTAIDQMSIWQKNFFQLQKAKMAVNLSSKQLVLGNFIDRVENLLQETKLAPSYLKLEITESLLIRNFDFAVSKLEQLSQLGIELSIDDFGTGYSSLGRLQNLPVSTLKIDRSFVSHLRPGKNLEIIKAIANMAHSLKLSVVVEGIETATQLELIKNLNCNEGQGFYFAKPQPADSIATLLTQELPWMHHFPV